MDDDGGLAAGLPNSQISSNVAIQSAINVAAAQRKVYYDAVGYRAGIRNGLPWVLLPLSAVAIYKGISGTDTQAGRNTLLKEGLAGASIYGLASYYNSPTREQVYLEGAKALSCSIYAVTPYYLPDELARPLSLEHITELQQERDAVSQALEALKQREDEIFHSHPDWKTQTTAQTQLTRSHAAAAAAATSLSNADAVIKESITDQNAITDAAAKLRLNIEDIVAAVDDQLVKLEPDPSTLLSLSGSLVANAQKLAPGASFKAPGSIPPTGAAGVTAGDQVLLASMQDLEDAIAALLKVQSKLDQDVAKQRLVTATVTQRINKAVQLSACEVKKVAGRLEVSPSDASMDLHLHEIKQFTLRSGAGIPNAEFVGTVATTAGRPVSLQKQVAGNTLIVSVTYDTEVEGVSTVTIEFSDGTALDGQKTVSFNLVKSEAGSSGGQNPTPLAKLPVAKPKPKANPPPESDAADKPANPTEQALPEPDRKTLQQALGVPQTGKFDDATHQGIRRWQDAHQWTGPHDGHLTPALLEKIGKTP